MSGFRQTPELRFIEVPGPLAVGDKPRKMAWWDWSARPEADPHRVVVCVHGLSRQGRDFDVLAQSLTVQARVIAVDVAGRGQSDWLVDPMAYQVGTYAADMAVLLAQLRAQDPQVQVDWVGTSMGGLIGIALAAQPGTGLRRLVLNDVGPVIQWEALCRIGAYVGRNPSFGERQEAIDYLRTLSAGFGPHDDETWTALSVPMLRERDGRWWLHYDPAIGVPVRAMTEAADQASARQVVREGEAALWALYDAIQTRTLLLRGAVSDLLSPETARMMGERGPRARCIEFAGVGHAPTLVASDQVAAVAEFLAQE